MPSSLTAHSASPPVRIGYVLAAAALGAGLASVMTRSGGGWYAVTFGLAPDLAFLFAGGRGLAKGQIHPRAVPLYNALHSLLGPGALAAVAAVFGLDLGWLVAALAWATHITTDRALGFGHRTAEGCQRSAHA